MIRYNLVTRSLMKLVDLIRDPRNPIRIPYYLAKRTVEPDLELREDLEVKISITVDAEHDFGIPETLGELSTVKGGLNKLLEVFEDRSIEGTFFVSNPIVENFPDLVEKASKRHEIGVHGYNHECWSEPKWWLGDSRILEREQKEILLERVIKSIEGITSERPSSFRAPYLASNEETLQILDKLNFRVDSSAPSYYGVFQKPYALEGTSLIEVPVSADPQPKIYGSPFPHVKFSWLNTKLLSMKGVSQFMDLVKKIVRCQIQEKIKPHVVMLLHQWEFAQLNDTPIEDFSYVMYNNGKKMKNLIEELENKFALNFVSINDLAEEMMSNP